MKQRFPSTVRVPQSWEMSGQERLGRGFQYISGVHTQRRNVDLPTAGDEDPGITVSHALRELGVGKSFPLVYNRGAVTPHPQGVGGLKGAGGELGACDSLGVSVTTSFSHVFCDPGSLGHLQRGKRQPHLLSKQVQVRLLSDGSGVTEWKGCKWREGGTVLVPGPRSEALGVPVTLGDRTTQRP